jgi:CBS domain-containing protein
MLPVVREYMDQVLVTVPPDMPILDCVDCLLSNAVTGAPVLDGSGTLIGIVTAKDCLRILSAGQDAERPSGTVRDFMTPNPKTVPPGMDIYFAAGLFLGNNFRRLPVVEDGALIGAITRFDILRAISAHYQR